MEFNKWESYYENIIKDLGFSKEKDDEAAQILVDLLKDRSVISLDDLSARIEDKDTLVFGLGPSLEEDADKVLDLFGIQSGGQLPEEPLIVTADGATSVLLQRGIDPHIIVSDLDGNVEDQVCRRLDTRVEANVAVAQRHRTGCVPARRIPGHVVAGNRFVVGRRLQDAEKRQQRGQKHHGRQVDRFDGSHPALQ